MAIQSAGVFIYRGLSSLVLCALGANFDHPFRSTLNHTFLTSPKHICYPASLQHLVVE